jgi:hypothetical protein
MIVDRKGGKLTTTEAAKRLVMFFADQGQTWHYLNAGVGPVKIEKLTAREEQRLWDAVIKQLWRVARLLGQEGDR